MCKCAVNNSTIFFSTLLKQKNIIIIIVREMKETMKSKVEIKERKVLYAEGV